jgi:hypothetical protein
MVPGVRILDCGWFGKVPHAQIGMVDELERCVWIGVQYGFWIVLLEYAKDRF